jgi:hypothetical protein
MSNPFSSQPKTVTSTQSTEPWAGQKPYLEAGFKAAGDLYKNNAPAFYPGSTVAPFSPTQQQAMGMARNRAIGGSDLTRAAGAHTRGVLGGDFLRQGNPHLDNVFEGIRSRVLPAVNSQFSAAGRYGSGAHADTMTSALTREMAPFAFQTYGAERQAMEDAARFAPQLAQEDWRDIGMLGAVGDQEQQLGQREIDDATARWSYYQDLPRNMLNEYLSQIQGAYGGTTTSQTPYYQPGWGTQMLGAGLGLAGAAGGLGFRPFG